MGGAGAEFTVAGNLKSKVGGVTTKDDAALLFSSDGATWATYARKGAAGTFDFVSFLDPVANDAGEVAFLAGITESGKARTALFAGPPAQVRRIAALVGRASDETGSPTTAIFSRFLGYALPSGPRAGVVFLAKTSGGDSTKENRLGIWVYDPAASLTRRILRAGAPIVTGGPALKSMTLLTAPRGAFGTARSYNATASLALRATFEAKTEALLRLDLP